MGVEAVSRRHRRAWLWISLSGAALCALCAPGLASAVPIEVNITADELSPPDPDTGCSLREAVQAANTDGDFGGCSAGGHIGFDTINLNHPSYVLTRDGLDNNNTNGDLDVFDGGGDVADENLTIQPGIALLMTSPGTATISGDMDGVMDDRVLEIIAEPTGDDISLIGTGLVLTGGRTPADGGAVNVNDPAAGGESVTASFGLTTFTGNATSGSGSGGAAANNAGTLLIEESTISGNSATGNGGGVYHAAAVGAGAAETRLENVTITDNRADSDGVGGGDGGGVYGFIPGASLVTPLLLYNTIVAGNLDQSAAGTVAPDCFEQPSGAGLFSSNNNLIGNTAGCTINVGAGDVRNVAPGLAGLALIQGAGLNGMVLAHDLLAGSPARDAGSPSPVESGLGSCGMLAQNFGPRPINGRCDIGSVEAAPVPPPGPSATPASGKRCRKGFRLKKVKTKKGKRKKKCIRKKRKRKRR